MKLPKYLNGYQGSNGYSLLVIGRENTSVFHFNGQGKVQRPLKWGNIKDKYGVIIGEYVAGLYDTKEEASATLDTIIRAYSQKRKA